MSLAARPCGCSVRRLADGKIEVIVCKPEHIQTGIQQLEIERQVHARPEESN